VFPRRQAERCRATEGNERAGISLRRPGASTSGTQATFVARSFSEEYRAPGDRTRQNELPGFNQREMETQPVLSVLIVCYNARGFMDECLASVRQHADCPYEILVVDNASTDGVADYLREAHPDVRLIESEVNAGFTGGNNLGAHHARGEVLLLLNADTRIESSLAPCVQQILDDPQIGAVGCRLQYGDGRLQGSVGYDHTPTRVVLSWTGLARVGWMPAIFRRQETSPEFYARCQPSVDWVSGACLFTRTELWHRLGGLDERFFIYVEEVEYCKRVRQAGYRVAYTPATLVTHFEGLGRPWIGERAFGNAVNSYLTYGQLYYKPPTRVAVRAGLGLVFFLRGLLYGAQAMLSSSPVAREKRGAFMAGARRLWIPQ
jgi:N-acetylglucosaminyl-diphospho-decaprenol L-rhamnosyltransferase